MLSQRRIKMAKRTIAHLKKNRSRLANSLPPMEMTLRGSLYKRFIQCGKPLCRCKKPPARGHGPYHYLTVNYGVGNTVSIKVPPQMVDDVARWVGNYKELYKRLEAISKINLELIRESKQKQKNR